MSDCACLVGNVVQRALPVGRQVTAMRIVFDFNGDDSQSSASVSAYSTCRQDQPSQWGGSRCELMIIDLIDWKSDEHRREGDVIYIEGDTASIKAALREALNIVELNEELVRERTEKRIAEEQQCSLCGYWVHPRDEWHADGHGYRCGTPESTNALAERGRIRRRVKEPASAEVKAAANDQE
jgi:hypothetical protein